MDKEKLEEEGLFVVNIVRDFSEEINYNEIDEGKTFSHPVPPYWNNSKAHAGGK